MDLGRAIVLLAEPELQKALIGTGKFSPTLPYRFDPILRRGVKENQLTEEDITALLASPSLATSQPVLDKLTFDQPAMTTEIFLEELTIGGTPKQPTVQIRASGKLYQQGNPNAIKTVSVRSDALKGKTPSDRLTAAAGQAFREIAAAFVEPPAAFDLPLPVVPVTVKGKKGSASTSKPVAEPMAGEVPGNMSSAIPAETIAAPASIPTAAPQILPTAPGAPLVPQLSAGAPPLGVTGEGATVVF